jgi:hypothetical protein
MATDVYTIDIVIALLNTVCFVNISIPKAKGKHICEEFKFVHESVMTLRDLYGGHVHINDISAFKPGSH